jgi:hypothetical protein
MDFQETRTSSANIKRVAAVVGGSAMIALAAVSVAIGQQSSAGMLAKSSSMTVGGTSTQTTPSTVPATPVAKPTIKGPAPLPSEEEDAK